MNTELVPAAGQMVPDPTVAVDFTINPRQTELVNAVMLEAAHAQAVHKRDKGEAVIVPEAPGIRIFHYGGAITGGKTIGGIGCLFLLAKAFPGSRWHIVRASFPDIRRTVLPSVDKVLFNAKVRWRKSADDYYVELRNGSRIYMFAENYARDKDLNRWKGLETNGFLLEQSEELREETYMKAIERAGRWYNVKGAMPPPIIIDTFNPAYNWIKKVHDAAERGELPADEIYIKALPKDNPFVTAEQRKQWKKMPPDVYARFIEGSWEVEVKGAFLNMFDEKKHVIYGEGAPKYSPARELWISFDFNVDPMTAIIFQTDGVSWFHVLKEYHIEGGDVYAACDAIRADWWHLRPMVRVTGDATGDNRMSGARGAVSQYRIISEQLHLDLDEFDIESRNPFIGDSRIYCNSVLRWLGDGKDDGEFYGVKINGDECPKLVEDCRFVQVGKDEEGKVAKMTSGINPYTNKDAKDMGHLMDCIRYGLHAGVPDFIEMHRS